MLSFRRVLYVRERSPLIVPCNLMFFGFGPGLVPRAVKTRAIPETCVPELRSDIYPQERLNFKIRRASSSD
jgi:hypothetical protein